MLGVLLRRAWRYWGPDSLSGAAWNHLNSSACMHEEREMESLTYIAIYLQVKIQGHQLFEMDEMTEP